MGIYFGSTRFRNLFWSARIFRDLFWSARFRDLFWSARIFRDLFWSARFLGTYLQLLLSGDKISKFLRQIVIWHPYNTKIRQVGEGVKKWAKERIERKKK